MPFTIGPKHHNVIPPALKTLVEEFFALQDWRGLYLSGGTCLAEYYFGHRLSIDMDLFTPSTDLYDAAARWLVTPHALASGRVEVLRKTPQLAQFAFHAHGAPEPIKVDLMLDVVPHVSPALRVKNVWVDSLEDILANKLGCLIQRSEVKDCIDLFHLIPASYLTIQELLELGSRKDAGLDPLIMAHQISWILTREPPAASLLLRTSWQDLQLFFRKFQKECLELIRPHG